MTAIAQSGRALLPWKGGPYPFLDEVAHVLWQMPALENENHTQNFLVPKVSLLLV